MSNVTINARPQASKMGKHGGWESIVYYPCNRYSGYEIRGETEYVNQADADAEAISRVDLAKKTGQAQ